MKRDCERFLGSLPEGFYDSHNSDSETADPKVNDQQLTDQQQTVVPGTASSRIDPPQLDPSQVEHLGSCIDCQHHLEAASRHSKLLRSLSQVQAIGSPEELSSDEFLQGIYTRAYDHRSARQHADLFQSLEQVSPPEELSSPEFFAGIIGRAAMKSEARVSPALTEGLKPVELPAHRETSLKSPSEAGVDAVHWSDGILQEEPTHTSALRSLTPSATPGWLWSRIRLDMQTVREQRLGERSFAQRRMFVQVSAAAAVITVSALLYSNFFNGEDSAKSLRSQIQFVEMNRPLDATPSAIVAGAAIAKRGVQIEPLNSSLGGLTQDSPGGVRHGG